MRYAAWCLRECATDNSCQYKSNRTDATRTSDGRLVFLKRVLTDSEELSLATYFSRDELRVDPANHCVQILDVITDVLNPEISYMVMPFLRPVHDPPFQMVEVVIHFVDQTLEVRA